MLSFLLACVVSADPMVYRNSSAGEGTYTFKTVVPLGNDVSAISTVLFDVKDNRAKFARTWFDTNAASTEVLLNGKPWTFDSQDSEKTLQAICNAKSFSARILNEKGKVIDQVDATPDATLSYQVILKLRQSATKCKKLGRMFDDLPDPSAGIPLPDVAKAVGVRVPKNRP